MSNRFDYPVKLVPLSVKNTYRDDFRTHLLNIPYLLYEVEKVSDGTSIVINKPGGKKNFGRMSKNDLQVFIYNPNSSNLWLISHNEILEDLDLKFSISPEKTMKIIKGLYRVCSGEEPDVVISYLKIVDDLTDLKVETLYKSYKWIWGQEDCNYPNGEGRWLSMNSILERYKMTKEDCVV